MLRGLLIAAISALLIVFFIAPSFSQTNTTGRFTIVRTNSYQLINLFQVDDTYTGKQYLIVNGSGTAVIELGD